MTDRERLESGHSSGTAAPETLERQGRQGGALDMTSTALPGWPRLLDLEAAAAYVGLSPAMLREYVCDGTLPVTRPVRANTHRAHGIRAGKRTRRTVASEHVGRLLFDVRGPRPHGRRLEGATMNTTPDLRPHCSGKGPSVRHE